MAAADSLPDHIPVLVFCVVRFSEEEGSGVVFTKKTHTRERAAEGLRNGRPRNKIQVGQHRKQN
jgi:hypothetical protein